MQAAQRHPRGERLPGRLHGGGGERQPRQRQPGSRRLRGRRLQQHHLQPGHGRGDPREEGAGVAAQGRGHLHPAAPDHHLGPGLPGLHGPLPQGWPPRLLQEALGHGRQRRGDGGGLLGDHRLRHRPGLGRGRASLALPGLPRHWRVRDPHGLHQRSAASDPQAVCGRAVAEPRLGRQRAGDARGVSGPGAAPLRTGRGRLYGARFSDRKSKIGSSMNPCVPRAFCFRGRQSPPGRPNSCAGAGARPDANDPPHH
mmetsp:Transcript_22143/g.65994  ORF Transcript_22143/g.65994 Transcript_22143/m.65994 type:complete len:255 (-) Transcript_22143:121-885(-)